MSDWLTVDGWGFYQVSRDGQVRSFNRTVLRKNGTVQRFPGRLLSWIRHSSGYPCVRLRDESNGRSAMVKVHRLVALAFLGPQPAGKEVNHIDGNKQNPRVDNLEWVTSRENRKHAWNTGLRNRSHLPIKHGEENGRVKLTATVVASARARVASGESIRSLAREFGVDAKTMRYAVRGKTWRDVDGLPDPPEAGKRAAGKA